MNRRERARQAHGEFARYLLFLFFLGMMFTAQLRMFPWWGWLIGGLISASIPILRMLRPLIVHIYQRQRRFYRS